MIDLDGYRDLLSASETTDEVVEGQMVHELPPARWAD